MSLYKAIHFTLPGSALCSEESIMFHANSLHGAKIKASQWKRTAGRWNQCISGETFKPANEYKKTRGYPLDSCLYVIPIETVKDMECPTCETETRHDVVINSKGTDVAGWNCKVCLDFEFGQGHVIS